MKLIVVMVSMIVAAQERAVMNIAVEDWTHGVSQIHVCASLCLFSKGLLPCNASLPGSTDRLGLGIGVGSAVFLVIFFGIGALEIFLKKRAEAKDKKYVEEQKRRAKQKRAAKQNEQLNLPAGADLGASMNSSKSVGSEQGSTKAESEAKSKTS